MAIIIGVLLWAEAARVIRSQVLSTRNRLYVDAARTFGSSTAKLLKRHIVPSVAPLVVMEFVHLVKIAVILEASLGFLGLGDPVVKSWGTIVHYATARGSFLTGAWKWWLVPPGLCIAVVVVAFAFVGLWFEEEADPRLSAATARG